MGMERTQRWPQHPSCTPGWASSAWETMPRLHEIPCSKGTHGEHQHLCPLSNRVSTNFQEMLWGPLQHPGWVRLHQCRLWGKSEPGPGCRTMQGVLHFACGHSSAFWWLFTALISSGKKIPVHCMLPGGFCAIFLSCKWRMLELLIQRGFIFSLPGDRQLQSSIFGPVSGRFL